MTEVTNMSMARVSTSYVEIGKEAGEPEKLGRPQTDQRRMAPAQRRTITKGRRPVNVLRRTRVVPENGRDWK
jgi:hypothetical protein